VHISVFAMRAHLSPVEYVQALGLRQGAVCVRGGCGERGEWSGAKRHAQLLVASADPMRAFGLCPHGPRCSLRPVSLWFDQKLTSARARGVLQHTHTNTRHPLLHYCIIEVTNDSPCYKLSNASRMVQIQAEGREL
jgi:hypothetical protein